MIWVSWIPILRATLMLPSWILHQIRTSWFSHGQGCEPDSWEAGGGRTAGLKVKIQKFLKDPQKRQKE